MGKGRVKWFSDLKGYGFILPEEGGREVFVHFSKIDQEGYRSLLEGDEVEYEEEQSHRGPSATCVRKCKGSGNRSDNL